MKWLFFTVLAFIAILGNAEAKKTTASPAPCKICTFVVKIIESEIKLANLSIATAEKIAEQICKIASLQPSEKDLCNEIVGDIKTIADMVMKGLNVSEICTKLGFCDASVMNAPLLFKPHKVSVKSYEPCKTCQIVVETVKDVLNISEKTADEVIQLVKKICENYPGSEPECSKITSQIDLVVKLILKGLNPADICAELGICTKTLQTGPAPKAYDPCKTCNTVVTIVGQVLNITGATVDEVIQVVNGVCKMYPESEPECSKITSQIDLVVKLILKGLNPADICVELGFCTKTLQTGSAPKAYDQCKTCNTVVTIVGQVLNITGATVKEVIQVVNGVCKMYPESEPECSKITSQIDLVVKLILKGLNPGDICAELGFCTKTLQTGPSPKAYDPCKTCNMVVTIVDKVLKYTSATTKEVVEMVKGICKSYPSSEAECSKIADQVEKIVDLITQGLSPGDICKTLGFCSNAVQVKPAQTATNTKTCDICKKVVVYVKKIIKEVNNTLPEVKAAIELACSLTGVPEEECNAIVNMAEEIIRLVEQELDTNQICVEIGLCDKSAIHAPRAILRDHSITTKECPMCRYMVQVVSMATKWNVPKENLKNTVNFVCGLFKQKNEYVQCTKFSDNLDKVVAMVKSGKSPEQVCEWLGKCNTKEISELVLSQVHKHQSNALCETCKTVIETISNMIKEFDSNLKDVEAIVDELCGMLGDEEAQCKNIAGEVFQKIGAVLEMIEGELNPETICTTIAHVCP